jgi:hypothetical protein
MFSKTLKSPQFKDGCFFQLAFSTDQKFDVKHSIPCHYDKVCHFYANLSSDHHPFFQTGLFCILLLSFVLYVIVRCIAPYTKAHNLTFGLIQI